jgi:hypothetical protein
MRIFAQLPIAATALATAAIGLEISTAIRWAVSDQVQVAAVSPQPALKTMETMTPLTAIGAPRYRAEACDGDYVCGESGAWEPAAMAPAEVWKLASDGF